MMASKEYNKLQELFDLNDLKAGAKHLRDAGNVIIRSTMQLFRSIMLPLQVLFSVDDTSAIKKIVAYRDKTDKNNREVEAALRSLGAYGFDPDTILMNPVIGLAAMPIIASKFIFDEAGASDVPPWIKKAQDRIGTNTEQQTGVLRAMANLFYETAEHDPIGNLITEAAEGSRAEKEAIEVLKKVGIDIEKMREIKYGGLVESLAELRNMLKRRTEIFSRMKQIKTTQDIRTLVTTLQGVDSKIDMGKVESALKELEAADEEDSNAIQEAVNNILGSGIDDLKNEISDAIGDMPSKEDLEKSTHSLADDAITLMDEISKIVQKL